MNKNYRATDLINLCDKLEGKYVGSWDYSYHNYTDCLRIRIKYLIGAIDFALNGEDFRNRLYNDIKSLMYIDNEGKLQYKDF